MLQMQSRLRNSLQTTKRERKRLGDCILLCSMSNQKKQDKELFVKRPQSMRAATKAGSDSSSGDQAFLKRARCKARNGECSPSKLEKMMSTGTVIDPRSDHFEKMTSELEDHMSKPDRVKASPQLANFIKNVRCHMRKCTLPKCKEERLREIGFAFEKCHTGEANVWRQWGKVMAGIGKEGRREGVLWLETRILPQCARGPSKTSDIRSTQEMVLRALKVGDINPLECTRAAPVWNLRHTLSHIVEPMKFDSDLSLSPSAVVPNGGSVFFDGRNVTESMPKVKEAMQAVLNNSIPNWLTEFHKGKGCLREDELVDLMRNQTKGPRAFFDAFPLSVRQQGPQRLNLTDRIHPDKDSALFNCKVCEGHTHPLSSVGESHHCTRTMDMHPEIAKLKVAVWREVWHHLSPLSQVCPPTGCQVLSHFNVFSGGTMPHKDMNPCAGAFSNGQVVGSSTIVVTLLGSQLFEFCNRGGSMERGHHPVHSFLTDCCSVCTMDPEDHLKWCHQVRFPADAKETSVRVAMEFGWMGNRNTFLGSNCGGRSGDRAHTQAIRSLGARGKKNKSEAKEKACKRIKENEDTKAGTKVSCQSQRTVTVRI